MSIYSENNNICTWFYAESKGEESHYPQVGGISSSTEFQAIYLRCVVVFFATSVRQNPQANHILFTNLTSIPNIGNFNPMQYLKRLGVEIKTIDLTYKTPEGYHSAWRNQFYIFDILKSIANQCSSSDRYIILDSDCVWINSAQSILEDIDSHDLLTYSLGSRFDQFLPEADLLNIYTDLGVDMAGQIPTYLGGEWFAASGKAIAAVVNEIDSVWQYSLKRFQASKPKFYEEAFALSFIYHKLGYAIGSANPYIRRIWTEGSYCSVNVSKDDLALSIWHLPNEKKSGIRELFYQVTNLDSSFWSLSPDYELSQYLGSYLGIPGSNWRRQLWGWRNRQFRNLEKVSKKLKTIFPVFPQYVSGF